ncbi:MAG TPA: telomere-binding protein [Aldersonia sp.]
MMVRCPVHADREASLAVRWVSGRDNDGMVLLHCHGCKAAPAEIADALGLTLADLFDHPLPKRDPADRVGRSPRARTSGRRRPKGGRLPAMLSAAPGPELAHEWVLVDTYVYPPDAGGTIVEVRREECTACGRRHKNFPQSYIVDGRRRNRKPAGFTPVLYRLPRLVQALDAGERVWILEGEKDVRTAEELELVAGTNLGGAGGFSGSFPASSAPMFADADVAVVLDRDDAGWKRGIELASLLGGAGASVQLLLPATPVPKSDFTDHVAAGLWSKDDPWGGLVPVRAGEVTAHVYSAEVRTKAHAVEVALEQATLRSDRASAAEPGSKESGEESERAQRWAVEAERRFEPLADLVDRVRRQATEEGTDWVGVAVDEAVEAWRQARVAARATFELVGMALPPLLQDPEPDPEPEPDDAEAPDGPGLPHSEAVARGDAIEAHEAHSGGALRWGRRIVAPVYRIADGNLVEIVTNAKTGEQQAKLVLGIDARVVEMEYLEDTESSPDVDEPRLQGREEMEGQAEANPPPTEELTAVVIGYTHPDSGEFQLRRIPAKEYKDCGWIESLPGPPQCDSRPAGLAKVRDALKAAGGWNIRRVVRYRSTGWRRDDAGAWFYVHAGGAITATGARVAPVLLTGPLRMFDLPAPTVDPTRIREAFLGHSGAMLDRFPVRVAAPLLGHVFRSALGPNPWLLTLVGSPGSCKTSLASLTMHHWGEKWDRRRPATSMSGNGDTLNALRIKLNSSKDALYWADDVAPTKDFGLAQRALEEFARMVHNGEQRSRSTRDGLGILDGTAPRASAMVTSEVMPRPGSAAERMFVVPLQGGEIDLDAIKAFDDYSSRFGRALTLASFLRWLCPRLEQVRRDAFAEADRYAAELRAGGETVRRAEALAALWAGWWTMLEFLVDTGALTRDEADTVGDLVVVGLVGAAEAATDPDMPMRAGARARELITHALATGLCYVDDVETGTAPAWPLAGQLGWRRSVVGHDQTTREPRWREEPRGVRVGYVVAHPRHGEEPQLLMESTALEQVLKASAQTMTDAPQLDRGTAKRALYDEGILIAEQCEGRMPRYEVQRQIRCEDRRKRMVALRLWPLLGNDPRDGSDPWPLPPPPGPDAGGSGDGPGDGCGGAEELPGLFATLSAKPFDPGAGVGSAESADMGQSLTSSAEDHEEFPVGHYEDAEGYSALGEHVSPVRRCVLCGNDSAGWTFEGMVMHLPCWFTSTAASRAAATGQKPAQNSAIHTRTAHTPGTGVEDAGSDVADAEPTPVQVPAAVPAAVPAPAPAAASEARPQPPAAAEPAANGGKAVFTAPAAVLDVTGIWLADGTHRPIPDELSHVGHVAALVSELQLGVWTNDRWAAAGQIWVTGAMAQRFGIDTDGIGRRNRSDSLRALTAELPFVTDALAQGWQIGGGKNGGDRLGTWTRVWRGENRGVWVVLMPGLTDSADELPIMAGDPAPATIARRLALFADALRFPWTISPAVTGIDLMKAARPKNWREEFAPADKDAPTSRITPFGGDIDWSRPVTADEAKCRYVHAYDRGGSYLAAIAGLELPVGDATHYPDGREFDRKVPGYWLIEIGDCADWRYPHPLNPFGHALSEPKWVTTPALERARGLGYEPEILEAWVWPSHGRVLVPWQKRAADARGALDIDDVDAQAARDQLKVMYTHTIGILNSRIHLAGQTGFSPQRHFHIVAKATANIIYRIEKIGREQDRWPVAVLKDTIVYVSDDPNPVTAWPGGPEVFGRGLGHYKWEGSALLAEYRQLLTGPGYSTEVKKTLTTRWDPAAGPSPGDR